MPARTKKKIPRRAVVPIRRQVIENPSKGLNTLGSSTLIDDRAASDLMNIEFDETGVVRKRSGYTALGNALVGAKGLGLFVTESVRQLVTIEAGVPKYLSGIIWTAYTGGVTFSTTAEITFTQARSNLFVWDGINGGAYINGTACVRPGTIPKAKFAIFYQGIHFAAGVEGQPNRLYLSTTTDATDFTNSTADADLGNSTGAPGTTVYAGTGAQFVDVAKDDGDRITGLGKFADQLMIFKERSIYQLSLDATGKPAILPVANNTGCVNHKSIENVENDLVFLSREGMRSLGNQAQFFNAIRTNILTLGINPSIQRINPLYYNKTNTIYFDNKVILAAPVDSSVTNNQCFVRDQRFEAWSLWNNVNANAFLVFIDTDNTQKLLFMSDDGTQLYRWVPGQYNDNGAAIDAYWTSKAITLRNIDLTKRFADLGLTFRRINGVVSLTVYDDSGTASSQTTIGTASTAGMGLTAFGMSVMGTSGTTETINTATIDTPYRRPLNQNSRTLKFKVANNRVDENFVLLNYIVGYYVYSHFKFDSTRKI